MIFETSRLMVRAFTPHDAALFFEINGSAIVMKHIRKVLTNDESDDFLHENIRFYSRHPALGRWCVTEKQGGSFVGTFALIYLPFPAEKNNIQIGYALRPQAWGHGYATELTRAGIIYYFKHHADGDLHAITTADNSASKKVLIKCGFAENGEQKDGTATVVRYILKRSDYVKAAL